MPVKDKNIQGNGEWSAYSQIIAMYGSVGYCMKFWRGDLPFQDVRGIGEKSVNEDSTGETKGGPVLSKSLFGGRGLLYEIESG